MTTTTCEIVFGRLTAAEIATVNTCASCAGTGERISGGGVAMPCTPCRATGRPTQAGYAYAASMPVEVGDVVGTPASDWNPASEGTVVRIGSEYGGTLRMITHVAVHAADRPELAAADQPADDAQPAGLGAQGGDPE